MDYFPVFLQVRGADCLVVGGGEVAARKAVMLLRAGAHVHVVALELSAGMQEVLKDSAARHSVRGYASSDIDSAHLVVAATDDRDLNARISTDARAQRVPVNVVDDPELCTFIMPAIVDRSPLVIAVSSTGASPVLARITRGKIEAAIPAQFGPLAALCSALRSEVRSRLPDVQTRRRYWETALEGLAAELACAGDLAAAEREFHRLLETWSSGAKELRGEVYLIGIGPNDPELISFRALRLMERAELVLAPARVADSVLDLCRRDAPRERFVELAPDTVQPLAARAIAAAKSGARVCIVGIGDAFRSAIGEDLRARILADGYACVVVPGVGAP